jgi:hypothetical protein
MSEDQRTLSSQALFYVYSEQKVSKRSFDDPFFKNMLHERSPGVIPTYRLTQLLLLPSVASFRHRPPIRRLLQFFFFYVRA